MIIKVCGMRDAENIRQVASLGVDMIGLIFCRESSRFVSMLPSLAGILPDHARRGLVDIGGSPSRVGVFVDDMPQTIVANVYNYKLDYVQLHGSESPTMIDNLRHTLDPDIRPGIKIIKAISVADEEDVKQWRQYRGHADMLLFDTKGERAGGNGHRFSWRLLDEYDGDIPFLLSGGIGLEDAEEIKGISHPLFAGVDLNSRFELSPGVKDVDRLAAFVRQLRGEP